MELTFIDIPTDAKPMGIGCHSNFGAVVEKRPTRLTPCLRGDQVPG